MELRGLRLLPGGCGASQRCYRGSCHPGRQQPGSWRQIVYMHMYIHNGYSYIIYIYICIYIYGTVTCICDMYAYNYLRMYVYIFIYAHTLHTLSIYVYVDMYTHYMYTRIVIYIYRERDTVRKLGERSFCINVELFEALRVFPV